MLLQVFLAGAGIFTSPSWFAMHRFFGNALSVFPIAMLILALVGRQPRLRVVLSGLLFVLVGLQGALIQAPRSMGAPLISALHPVNALVIFALGAALLYAVWHDVRQTAEPAH
ncbi:MAG: DUF6220 domain-containing protein [Ktedonobacterales bacterium]